MSARAWLAFLTLGITWGVPYFFIELAVRELSPFDVAWGRITLAALILLPIAWRRGALRTLVTHKAAVVAFALIEFAIPFSAISMGERWIPSSVTAILIATVPITVAIISRFFGVHERLSAVRLLGLAVGLAGVIALVGFGTLSGPRAWAGVGCVLIATIGYSIGPLIIQRHLHAVDSIGPVAGSLCIASLLLLVPAMLSLPQHVPSVVALSSVALLGLVCTALSMLVMFYLVKSAGAARATLITYINPAVATLLGVALLGERLGVGGIVGFALVLLGSWLATRRSRPAAEVSPSSRASSQASC
ncbi:MAG TPA: DMT family transporter [Steroidobacteraceae bacterium]|nr:DMT family transporter [Steroidobacteraceae bacterium]